MDEITTGRLYESLLGTAIGDSLGLPYEGLKASRAKRLLKGEIRPRLWFGKSFVSDDTLQTIFVLQSLHVCNGDVQLFQRELAKRLRSWFLAIPPGIGKSTVIACFKLAMGSSPTKSGVNSGGNGAAMRSAIIGHWFANNDTLRVQFTEASARITHTNPDAITGAQIIALTASLSAREKLHELQDQIPAHYPEWPIEYPRRAEGPTGYVIETVNAALDICKADAEFQLAIEATVRMGGDTDSVAAIVGGILTTSDNSQYKTIASPTTQMLKEIAEGRLLRIPYFTLLKWHLAQLPIVLAFGLRRLFPPY